MSVKGYEELCLELDKITAEISNAEYLREAGEYVRDRAKDNVPVFNGELRDEIFMEMVREDGQTSAVVYTDNEHSIFVEVGTGQKGAANHANISPNISPVYAMHPWYVPESKLSPDAIAKYRWQKVVSKNGEVFYRMTGQAAQPYLYPALSQNKDTVIDICERGIDAIIGK